MSREIKKIRTKPKEFARKDSIRVLLSDVGILERTPQQEDIAIQNDRILYILEKTIQKLKVAISMRQLLKDDAFILRRVLKKADVKCIQNVCKKYMESTNIKMNQTLSNTFGTKSKDTQVSFDIDDIEDMIDPQMYKVNEIVWNCRRLRSKILTDLENTDKASCFYFSLINAVKTLRDISESRLAVSASQEKERDRALRKAWLTSSNLNEHLDKIHDEIEQQRNNLGNEVDTKTLEVEDYRRKIDELLATFKTDLTNRVLESECAMVEDRHESVRKQEDLVVEAKDTTQQFETLLSQHVNQEKDLRKKRLKVETQLGSWLTKFDADVGDRQNTFDTITQEYDERKAEFDQLQIEFDEQELDYDIFMAEKAEEEQRLFEIILFEFVKNRAARRIQRCWRAYRQRKLDRKKKKGKPKGDGEEGGKGKKGKGKGKAEEPKPPEPEPPKTVEEQPPADVGGGEEAPAED